MGPTKRTRERIANAVRRIEGTPPGMIPTSGSPVAVVDRLYCVKLTEAMGATTAGEAAGVLVDWVASSESFSDTATTIAIVDPHDIFVDGTSGSYGFAYARGGNGRTVFILVQLECP